VEGSVHHIQAASPNGGAKATAASGGPALLEGDTPKRQKAGAESVPDAAARSWAAAMDTSDDDFE